MLTSFTPDTTKMHTNERELILQVIDKKAPLSSTGIVDKRLFTGDTRLFAKMDPHYSLWYFQYTQGAIPPELQQRWTTFDLAFKAAKAYFEKRNVEISEVID
jgi:hypothetical protein